MPIIRSQEEEIAVIQSDLAQLQETRKAASSLPFAKGFALNQRATAGQRRRLIDWFVRFAVLQLRV